jgi:small subunit ribosomal protein S18
MAKPAVRKAPKKKQNPFKRDKITYVDYKDVPLLRKFLSERGKIRSRRVSGLDPQQQADVAKAVKNAREMGLLPYVNDARTSR